MLQQADANDQSPAANEDADRAWLLADRALSRLLGRGFPRSLEALEELLKSPR